MGRIFNAAFRVFCAWALIIGPLAPLGAVPAQADQDNDVYLVRISSASQLPAVRHVVLGLNKSMVVELPVPVRDVMVSNPKKIDAVTQTSRRIYIIGKQLGEANVFFTGQDGRQILTLQISIQRDLTALQRLLNNLIPGSTIKVQAFEGNVILSGQVKTPIDASRADEIAESVLTYDPDSPVVQSSGTTTQTSGASLGTSTTQSNGTAPRRVINMITVEGREQVLLKVSVVEMDRKIVKELGVNINALTTSGNITFSALSSLPFPVSGGATTVGTAEAGLKWISGANSISSVIQALEQDGVVHTLAEPNLTAISGETANFLAGGEFPIPVSGQNGEVTVQFKKFGVGLAFTPVVMSKGRISLKISTEVSELSSDGAVSLPLSNTGDTVTIPALKVRRAKTTVELPSGGSLVIAGLLSNKASQDLTGYPGLKNLPVLGALFRSRDFQKNESELVVLVTPYIAKAVAPSKLARPDDGFGWASDVNSDLMGQMNRVYGRDPKRAPVGKFKGNVGFIVE